MQCIHSICLTVSVQSSVYARLFKVILCSLFRERWNLYDCGWKIGSPMVCSCVWTALFNVPPAMHHQWINCLHCNVTSVSLYILKTACLWFRCKAHLRKLFLHSKPPSASRNRKLYHKVNLNQVFPPGLKSCVYNRGNICWKFNAVPQMNRWNVYWYPMDKLQVNFLMSLKLRELLDIPNCLLSTPFSITALRHPL